MIMSIYQSNNYIRILIMLNNSISFPKSIKQRSG